MLKIPALWRGRQDTPVACRTTNLESLSFRSQWDTLSQKLRWVARRSSTSGFQMNVPVGKKHALTQGRQASRQAGREGEGRYGRAGQGRWRWKGSKVKGREGRGEKGKEPNYRLRAHMKSQLQHSSSLSWRPLAQKIFLIERSTTLDRNVFYVFIVLSLTLIQPCFHSYRGAKWMSQMNVLLQTSSWTRWNVWYHQSLNFPGLLNLNEFESQCKRKGSRMARHSLSTLTVLFLCEPLKVSHISSTCIHCNVTTTQHSPDLLQ